MNAKTTPITTNIARNVEDWDEAFEYLPGTVVELKEQPGVTDVVSSYEPMMVPPIWLEHDPCPRYPHQLRVVSRRAAQVCAINSRSLIQA
ncbi:hypothetical protein ACQ4M4_02585 [Leptolyngbya sp. AN02str]|uniref:hypothetical protein n=1 Tax=Leptolyngbya sp. AN02str TaxID=3423363 RepID=UPI003D310C4C